MKKLLLSLLFSLSLVGTANAIPNVWTSGYAQGQIETQITNQQGHQLSMTLNGGYWADDDSFSEADTIYLSLKNGKTFNGKQIQFIIDGKPQNQYKDWSKFEKVLEKGKVIDVYINKKKLATFTPTKASAKKVWSRSIN